MEKQALLASLMCEEQEKVRMAHLLDLADASRLRNMPTFSRFLNEQEQALAKVLMQKTGTAIHLYGAYEDAERRVAVFLPDYLDEEALTPSLCGLTIVRCEADRYHDIALTHRDYLGAIMALGVERETVGDILIDGKTADLILVQSAAFVLLDSLTSVGRCSVTCTEVTPEQIRIPRREYEYVSDTVASLRLDCVVASAFRLSREEAAKAVHTGRTQVNGRVVQKLDFCVGSGDKISLRGGGRAILTEIGGVNKKGRIRIVLAIPK